MRTVLVLATVVLATLAAIVGRPAAALAQPAWPGFAGNAQHTAIAATAAQPLSRIRWQSPLDVQPQPAGGAALAHYASPLLTAGGLLLLAVKDGPAGDWHVHAHRVGAPGLLWGMDSDYVLPPHDWVPAFPMALTPQNRVAIAGAGGTVLLRATPDSPAGTLQRQAFYGLPIFHANAAAMTASVMIATPITADAAGTLYFGFVATGPNPAGVTSGIARIDARGRGTWIGAAQAAGDAAMTQVAMGCAPALSPDGSTLYIAVSNGAAGYLLGLHAATLAPRYKVALLDPSSGYGAWISDQSSASPSVGPDGDVYYGVLENPFPRHNDRGWLLHFDRSLAIAKTPGSFGWDETVSILPAASLPRYHGTSPYLLMSKDNNYRGIGSGDGRNRIVILDPGAAGADPILPTVATMQVVQALAGPTPYPGSIAATYEWCMNSAVIDPSGPAVMAISEDGHLYRWDLPSNAITQSIALGPPQAQAYTPSAIGPDGTVLAIGNGRLFAIGR